MSTDPTRPGEPEYLGEAPSAPTSRVGRTLSLLAIVAAGVVGVVGLGSWATVSLMAGGSQPAEAVPANAIGFVSLDLDPSARQKVEAVQMLQKFPAIADELDISSQDDLRRWVFEHMQEDGSCTGLDYEADVEPWIGDRVALAGVPAGKAGKSPIPVVALQVSDPEAAEAGIAKLAECGETGRGYGVAISGDYALISDSAEHADTVAESVAKGTLADDADYRKWMGRIGDPGIVTMYVAPGAMAYLADVQDSLAGKLPERPGAKMHLRLPVEPDMAAMRQKLEKLSGDFEGMAGVVRFEDGAVEAEFVGETTREGLLAGGGGAGGVTELPDTTAVALGVSLPEEWAQETFDLLGELMGTDRALDAVLRDAEAMTGLELPEDVERLLGEGFAVAVDEGLDVSAAERNPLSVPAGIRVTGDPAEIGDVVAKFRATMGPVANLLVTEDGDGVVALGVDADYVGELADAGELGDRDSFQDVVPEADSAGGVLFVDFDTVEAWVSQSTGHVGRAGLDEAEVRANLAPIRALGVSTWVEDDGSERAFLRLSTD